MEIYTYDILPPFAYRDQQGNLTGIYIEMVRRAIERMPDYSASFNVVPWERAKEKAKIGEAFAILPPYFHAHDWLNEETNKPYIWPYSMALHYQSDVVICNAKVIARTPRPNFPSDYRGLTFVMFRGDGRAGPKFQKMADKGEIKLLIVNNTEKVFPILQTGRADCAATSELSFKWNIRNLKASGEYKKYKEALKNSEKYEIIPAFISILWSQPCLN